MGGDAHLRNEDLFARLCAAFVGDEGQVRRPGCQLGLPVGQQRGGRHDEPGTALSALGEVGEKGNDLTEISCNFTTCYNLMLIYAPIMQDGALLW